MQWLEGSADDWRRRARANDVHEAWAQFLGQVAWQLFVTLTFDPKRVFPVDQNRASREAFWWCSQTSRIYRRPLGWMYAPERDTSGQWHVHVLMIGGPCIGGKPSTLPEAAGMWTARNGHIDVQQVRDVSRVAWYATKQAAASGEIVWSDTITRYLDF